MTFERLRRIIRSRWWVLTLTSLVSIVATVLAIQARNDAIPAYEAIAGITFNRLLGEVDDTAAQDRLDTAEDIANSVNASDLTAGVDPLSPEARADIVSRGRDLSLLFIGRGATEEEAAEVATRMRDRYLAAQQLDFSTQLNQRIADVADRLEVVVAAIAAHADPPDGVDIETSSRIRELQAEVDTLAGLYGTLTAELLTPLNPPRPQATILEERDSVSEALRAAQNELLSLEYTTGGAAALDAELALLRAEEEQLRVALDTFVAQSIVEEPIGVVGQVTAFPSGIDPTPLPMAIILGLLIGLLVGVAGLVIVDRVRRPLWEPAELEPRYRLPEVVARPRVLGDAERPWYDTASSGRRKAQIQELRSAVEGLPGFGSGVVVGVASLTGPSPNVHELAADLAAGLTSSGSWALLIDADYGQPSDLPEFRRHNLELEDVVDDPRGTIGDAALGADRGRDFVGVFIRERRADSADLLAQPAFARMLDTAQATHDVVVVACPPTDSASYHVLSQRLDAMILVAIAGDTAPAEVVLALRTLEERRSLPAGVVLISPRVGPISLVEDKARRPPPTPDPVGPHHGEWQWSTHRNAAEPTGHAAAQVAAAPPAAQGLTDDIPFNYRRVGSVRDDAASAAAEGPGGDDAADTASPEADVAEVALWTERIRRRAFPKRGDDNDAGDTDVRAEDRGSSSLSRDAGE